MLNKVKNKAKYFYYMYIAKRISHDTAIRLIIDKELEKYKVNMDFVLKNPKIGEENWFQYYTFDSKEEELKWKEFSRKILKKAYPFSTDKYLEQQLGWITLMWGLRSNYEYEY